MANRGRPRIKPATTPEGREKQLISLAMDRAQEQLENGTASAQVITHFLKLGTIEAELELEKRRRENDLLEAKTNQIQSSQRMETLIEEAIKAFKGYSGEDVEADAIEEELYGVNYYSEV